MTLGKKPNFEVRDLDSFGARFGRLVRYRRGTEGVTQEELADRAFGDPSLKSRISGLELGKIRSPQQKTVDAISVALDIHPSEVSRIRSDVFEHDAEVRLSASRSKLEQAKEIHGWNHDSAAPQISYHDNLSMEELEQTSRLNLASTTISLGQKTGDKDLIAEGIAQYRVALAGARSVGNIRLEIATLNKLAEALKAMGDFEATVEMHLEAIQMLQQALRLSNEAKGHPNDD